ncbi:N-6 DNA methylase [Lancefieldella parvula DSM 20469]|uniref:N-6 DNA methylase n=1 Tax=Lancefieldella parvula (strain ATCC 33793 / DSM 20469 / CCUG 32760 / JCM 10300 / KCTC 3663 / VPI 0546 / 1246) TaxID=521095 RepID=C8W861_LANP1|nr:N-6 DNA methylase [Lancefieldella parvula]ACV51651.1 N-6 DNA methylase [Lancefieldella parvula DSM 20469]
MAKLKYQEKDGKVYCPLKDKWLIATPEEKVRQRYVCTLVNDFGYQLEQMAQELKVTNSKRGQGKARADIVIWKSTDEKDESKSAFIVVECKAENVKIHVEDYYQGFNYASWAHAQFFVTTNEKETKYFNVDPTYLPQKLEEVVGIPTAKDVDNAKKIEQIKNRTKTFTREEFTRTLQACHNIIRNNDKLSPEAAFDEISKLLFMKIRYERQQRGTKVFTRKQYEAEEKNYEENIRPGLKGTVLYSQSYMQRLFSTTKEEFKDDHLFEDSDEIKIRNNSFIQILGKLENFNLSDTQDDVKGIAFEQFLGTTFRGELGQFFTPRTIVDFMTEIIDPQEGEIICDPTCGSGGFLIKAFEYVREKIEADIREQKEKLRSEFESDDFESKPEDEQIRVTVLIDKMQAVLNAELDTSATNSRMQQLSRNCIYGTDANPRMARTSKMNMIMHGDGHGGVHHHDGLLNVNGIFEERFDVILTNPPFGQNVDRSQTITDADRFTDEEMKKKYRNKYGEAYDEALKQVDDHIGKPLLSLYDLGSTSTLTEVLFMERCLRLLKKGGRMGMVLPEGVLNNKNLAAVREYFEGKAKLILICSIPQDVFIAAGATVKPSLVFMRKFTAEEEAKYAKCKQAAADEVAALHKDEVDELEKAIAYCTAVTETLKDDLKDARSRLKQAKKDKAKTSSINAEINAIQQEQTDNKTKKKEVEKTLKDLQKRMIEEVKPLIKKNFDYDIPIAKIDDAGITTTGAASEGNQLPALVEEYKAYRKEHALWETDNRASRYIPIDEDSFQRVFFEEGEEVH